MTSVKKSLVGIGILVLFFSALWKLLPVDKVVIYVRGPATWNYKINGPDNQVMGEKIELTAEQISAGITIWAVGYDTITLYYVPKSVAVDSLTVHLSNGSAANDGTYEGIAKKGNKPLWYNLTDPEIRTTDNDSRYSHTATDRAAFESTIIFREKINEGSIGSLKIKKKKKDTQVDVYLDDANKDN